MSEESKKWYRMTRPLFNSGYEDDEFFAYGQDGFLELLDTALGMDVLLFDKRIDAEPVKLRAVIQSRTADTFNSADDRQILCPIGTLHCGQYVKFDGGWWLVSGIPGNNRIYEKAFLWKCRHNIRLLSPLTGEIVEYPVVSENSTQYGTGEENKTHMTVGDDQHLVYLPYNEETILLDNQFRFIMDKNKIQPSVFRVTRVDPVSYAAGEEAFADGLIQWSVIETQFNEATDSREEMIADFYKSGPGGESGQGQGGRIALVDMDGDQLLTVGEKKRIRVDLTPVGDTEDLPDYALSYDLADGAAEVTGVEENVITLAAANDTKNVGKTVAVHAAVEEWDAEASLEIQIVGW